MVEQDMPCCPLGHVSSTPAEKQSTKEQDEKTSSHTIHQELWWHDAASFLRRLLTLHLLHRLDCRCGLHNDRRHYFL